MMQDSRPRQSPRRRPNSPDGAATWSPPLRPSTSEPPCRTSLCDCSLVETRPLQPSMPVPSAKEEAPPAGTPIPAAPLGDAGSSMPSESNTTTVSPHEPGRWRFSPLIVQLAATALTGLCVYAAVRSVQPPSVPMPVSSQLRDDANADSTKLAADLSSSDAVLTTAPDDSVTMHRLPEPAIPVSTEVVPAATAPRETDHRPVANTPPIGVHSGEQLSAAPPTPSVSYPATGFPVVGPSKLPTTPATVPMAGVTRETNRLRVTRLSGHIEPFTRR